MPVGENYEKKVADSEIVRRKMGRPTVVTEELKLAAHRYIEAVHKTRDLPTIEGLAISLNISRDTIYEWEKTDKDPEFSDIIKALRSNQAEKLIQNGLQGRYNPMITKLLLSKHGYVEKSEVDNTHSVVQFMNDVPRPSKKVENGDSQST